MRLCRLFLPVFAPLLLFFVTALPGHALRPDVLYSPQSGFLQVSPMRALTLNAHISAFQFDPLGLEIAFVGEEASAETTTHFVKVVDARSGHEMERLSLTVPIDPEKSGCYRLLGWSSSGKYLMLERFLPPSDPSAHDDQGESGECLRWDVSANPPTARVIAPDAPLPDGANLSRIDHYFSPSGQRLIFQQIYRIYDPEQNKSNATSQISLYDPEKNAARVLTLPHGLHFRGWLDDSHLQLFEKGQELLEPKVYDVLTNTLQNQVNHPAASLKQPISRRYPDLTLEVEYRPQVDMREGSDGQIASYIVWIRRNPKSKKPLGVAAAGLTPGEDDPQAVWSPTGRQIGFLAHGDLYVTDLAAPTKFISEEKLAVGLPLTGAEEQTLAASNLKQIGLGIVQYTQDFDEHWPKGEDFENTIYPYLKSRLLFEINGHRFVYIQPADLTIAAMDELAATEMGYMDLPSARIVLFADGHVKTFSKVAP